MTKINPKNYAYIDGANLDKGTIEHGWRIDYAKFYVWLKDKFAIDAAYIFIGYIPKYENLYSKMRTAGFTLIFKEITQNANQIKGNCDTDLVLRAVRDVYEYSFNSAVLISSDGDFLSLIQFFKEKGIEINIVSPRNSCSFLLRKTNSSLYYLNNESMKIRLVPDL